MKEELQIRVEPRVAAIHDETVRFVAQKLGIKPSRIAHLRVLKRSIDARQRQVMVNLTVRVWVDEVPENDALFTPIVYDNVANAPQAVVVGAGPGGLFAALRLIQLGVRPIVLERGKNVNDRRKDLAQISRQNIIDPDSNYCFGEGGAGAYSDGKLYTRSKKRGNVERILQIFCQHGASENILIDAHPHIGTDKLPGVIQNIREQIIASGGEVRFCTKVTDLLLENGEVKGVRCANGSEVLGPVILATGHSARDVYEFLNVHDIPLETKGIAVGVRLEHPQHLIDCMQYHSPKGRGEYLPAAEYSFVTQINGRGVYSFCMCPGGFIVPAASEPGQLVVNGMSPSNRGTKWSNSGMVVEIRPEDLPQYEQYGVMKMMRFQQDLERECFNQAGGTQRAGAQRMLDFVQGKPSSTLPPTSYAPGIQPSRLDQWLPKIIGGRLRKGFEVFGRNARGFLTNDAIVIGIETRTSSPIRIPRDASLMRHITVPGLYPCGEGAGYAGGIVSAAIDGERCAESLAATMKL
ncbi:MAG: FAD-binding protein [Muribaculaceae bacterium]|nr:FAD-binding protein [Muribaculaceae bacterium]